MTHRRLSTQLLDGEAWSTHLCWSVTLHCDHRGNVTDADAWCEWGKGLSPWVGTASTRIGPFDDLPAIVRDLMIAAATSVSEQIRGDQGNQFE